MFKSRSVVLVNRIECSIFVLVRISNMLQSCTFFDGSIASRSCLIIFCRGKVTVLIPQPLTVRPSVRPVYLSLGTRCFLDQTYKRYERLTLSSQLVFSAIVRSRQKRLKGNSMESEIFVDELITFLKITTTNDPFSIATIIDRVGKLNVSSGEYKTAIKYYEKSLQIYREISHLSGTINSNLNLGDTHYKLAQYQTAIEYYKNSLDMSTTMGEQLEIARSNCRLGIVYCGIGNDKQAVDCFEEALKICSATGNRSGIAAMNCNLGNAYRRLEEYQKAIEFFVKSLEINTAIGDQSRIATDNNNLGIVYCDLGEYQKAIKYHEKGLEISSAIGD